MSRTPRRPARLAAVIGATITVIALLPVQLVGALAVELQRDLAFSVSGLGIAIASYRVAAAVASPFLGVSADRIGSARSVAIAALLAGTASLGIGLLAINWIGLLLCLMFGGLAIAVAQPASNRLLSHVVASDRLGTAFGVKQSAPPVAGMFAGLSVPAMSHTIGWRWAFISVGGLAILATGLSRPIASIRVNRVKDRMPEILATGRRRSLSLLILAFALGTTASTAASGFYVVSAVRAGSAAAFAGIMLAIGSLVAVAVRLLAGILCDYSSLEPLHICAGLLATGAVGFTLLAYGEPNYMAFGIVVALGGAWGFNGVFWFGLIRSHSDIPGKVTGAVAPGALIGGTAGPILFGILAETFGYRMAWGLAGVVALLAAACMVVADESTSRVYRKPDLR